MARIAGITIDKPTKRTYLAHIDLRKHPRFLKELEAMGAIEIDEFHKKVNAGITKEELLVGAKEHINNLFDGK